MKEEDVKLNVARAQSFLMHEIEMWSNNGNREQIFENHKEVTRDFINFLIDSHELMSDSSFDNDNHPHIKKNVQVVRTTQTGERYKNIITVTREGREIEGIEYLD